MQKYIEKAEILVEAMPYIKKFHGKTVVIKYGGAAMTKIESSVIEDIAFLKMVGINPVVVHGGGPEINAALQNYNITPEFVDGLRVTNKQTMEVVEQVLSGKINKSIVSEFQKYNTKAVGISGKDGLLIEAIKKEPDIGYVGDITNINPKIITSLIEQDFLPVVSPVGTDNEGNTYNINADVAAVELAIALNADKLVFLTDIEGVREKADDADSLISKLTLGRAEQLIKTGVIQGGMLPKIQCCIKAVDFGVQSVHIINGQIKHSILLEIYTNAGVGTVIER